MNKPRKLNPIFAYTQAHAQALKLGIQRLLATPFTNLMMLLVLTIAFVFPTSLFLALDNLKTVQQHYGPIGQIQCFLQTDLSHDSVKNLAKMIESRYPVQHVDIIFPETGLQELIEQTHSDTLLNDLTENPLPPLLIVHPQLQLSEVSALKQLRQSLQSLSEVTQANLDNLWINRVNAAYVLLRKLFYGLVVLFGAGVFVVIASSVRATSQLYQEQICLFNQVGATPTYTRRPFLYSAIIMGLLAGLLCWGIVNGLVTWLNPAVLAFSTLLQSPIEISLLNPITASILVLIASISCYLSAYFSTTIEIHKRR